MVPIEDAAAAARDGDPWVLDPWAKPYPRDVVGRVVVQDGLARMQLDSYTYEEDEPTSSSEQTASAYAHSSASDDVGEESQG